MRTINEKLNDLVQSHFFIMIGEEDFAGRNSVELLEDKRYFPLFDKYSIRFHDATNMHLDYAIGSDKLAFCVDFLVPSSFRQDELINYSKHKYRGHDGKTLAEDTIKNFLYHLPYKKKARVFFMPTHETTVLLSKKGLIHEILEGFGKGEWFVIKNGDCHVEKHDSGFLIVFGKTPYDLTHDASENRYWLNRHE